jgi:hypothetical protein
LINIGIELSIFRARIGRTGKENNIAAGYPKILISQVRLLFTFTMLSSLLLLCGDVESNLDPNFKQCAVCGVMQKDVATLQRLATSRFLKTLNGKSELFLLEFNVAKYTHLCTIYCWNFNCLIFKESRRGPVSANTEASP